MKLRTSLTASYDGSLVDATDENLITDAAAAHALMRAMRQYEQDFPLSPAVAQDVIQWIEKRADELMREWGYSREGGE